MLKTIYNHNHTDTVYLSKIYTQIQIQIQTLLHPMMIMNLIFYYYYNIGMQSLRFPISDSYQLCADNAWCTYQAVDGLSIWVQISALLFILVLTIIITRYLYILLQYRTNQKHKQIFGAVFLRVFVIALLWVFCTVVKICINVAVYYDYIQYDVEQLPQPTRQSPLVYMSAIFNLFDSSSTFFIISLILMIPYEWFKILLTHLNYTTKQIPLQSRLLLQKSFTFLKILRIYMLSRTIILIFYLVETALMITTSYGCQLTRAKQLFCIFIGFISIIIAIVQSIIMLAIYGFVYYVAEHTKKYKLVVMRRQDYYRLKVQYILLVIAIFSRILLNSFFNGLADKILHYEPQQNCSDRAQDITLNHNDLKRTSFLIIGYFVMHILPICLVIYIYKPSLEDLEQNILKYEGSSSMSKSQRQSIENVHATTEIQNNLNVSRGDQKYQRLAG